MPKEHKRIIVNLHHVENWDATWIMSKAFRVSEKYDVDIELKSKPKGSNEAQLAIVVSALALYAGKKTIDLIYKELDAYLERRRKRAKEDKRPFEYNMAIQ